MQNEQISKVIFTNELLQFLIKQGYTYMYCKGVVAIDETGNGDEYILVPLKSTNNLKAFQDQFPESIIEDIKSSDIIDMSYGDPFIGFSVEIPTEDLENYLKQ